MKILKVSHTFLPSLIHSKDQNPESDIGHKDRIDSNLAIINGSQTPISSHKLYNTP